MKVEFNLLSNATDSIESAISLIAWGNERDEASRLKQSIQAIAHGIELLLKERLRRIHPVLLWENVDKYPSISARTVNSEGALSRLINIGGLNFPKEDIELIRSLRTTRNAIEHYAWKTTKDEAERIVGQALAFSLDFSSKQLNHSYFGYHSRKDDTFYTLVTSNKIFAAAMAEREKLVFSAFEQSSKTCNFCRSIAVNPETGTCSICGHWERREDSEEWDDDPLF
jgi:hypothetical protein